jgi:hypothetical protein
VLGLRSNRYHLQVSSGRDHSAIYVSPGMAWNWPHHDCRVRDHAKLSLYILYFSQRSISSFVRREWAWLHDTRQSRARVRPSRCPRTPPPHHHRMGSVISASCTPEALLTMEGRLVAHICTVRVDAPSIRPSTNCRIRPTCIKSIIGTHARHELWRQNRTLLILHQRMRHQAHVLL